MDWKARKEEIRSIDPDLLCKQGCPHCWKFVDTIISQEQSMLEKLEADKAELFKGLRKLAKHGKEAEKVCEMGFTIFEIANNLIQKYDNNGNNKSKNQMS